TTSPVRVDGSSGNPIGSSRGPGAGVAVAVAVGSIVAVALGVGDAAGVRVGTAVRGGRVEVAVGRTSSSPPPHPAITHAPSETKNKRRFMYLANHTARATARSGGPDATDP